MSSKVELLVTNERNQQISVDILDFEFRLNRNSYSITDDRMKTLGGTFSTTIKLAKTKRNKQFFKQSDWKSREKFYKLTDYKAILSESGVQIAIGVIRINSISDNSYDVTFFDQNISWLDDLSKLSLRDLGYVDGKPTWLTPYDGPISMDSINAKNNKTSDILLPTLVYNNTPVTDYTTPQGTLSTLNTLDDDFWDNLYWDDDIWGEYNFSDPSSPYKVTTELNFPNEFVTVRGYFSQHYGLTFEDFPPAVYYVNILKKIFEEIGISVDCSLFEFDWFNKLYMPYVGDGYEYNMKNLATVYADLLQEHQEDLDMGNKNFNIIRYEEIGQIQNLKNLPAQTIYPWLQNAKAHLFSTNILSYYDLPTLVDKISNVSPHNIDGQYICPVDGIYTIKILNKVESNVEGLDVERGNPTEPGFVDFDPEDVFNSFGTKNPNSSKLDPMIDRQHGWDDHVLVALRLNENGDLVYQDTFEKLAQWIAGDNTDFTTDGSDIIAYVSPKRYQFYNNGIITDSKQAFGSPLTNFESEVIVDNSKISHTIINDNLTNKSASSSGNFSVTLNMKKNERVLFMWVAVGRFSGDVVYRQPDYPVGKDFSMNTNVDVGVDSSDFSITYECGEYDLNIAKNLPNINCKTFIASFIKQFNLWFKIVGNTIYFLPVKEYFTKEAYDITERVQANNWNITKIPTPNKWSVGYNVDSKDAELNSPITACSSEVNEIGTYGNVIVNNDNIYAQNEVEDFNIFSSTKFITGLVFLVDYTEAGHTSRLPSIDPITGIDITKGFSFYEILADENHSFPSIQSNQSVAQAKVGTLEYDYNYQPRLLYHLGFINDSQFGDYDDKYRVLVGNPKGEWQNFARVENWVKLTISSFDTENNNPYPTLRYDGENGLYGRYFDNLVDLYNKSDILILKANLRPKDWVKMDGSQTIRFNDQAYRLLSITDYDPVTNNLCTVKLLKII